MKNDGRSLRINAKSGRASISLNAIPFLLDPTRRSEINGYITNTVKEIWGNVIIIVEKLLKRIDEHCLCLVISELMEAVVADRKGIKSQAVRFNYDMDYLIYEFKVNVEKYNEAFRIVFSRYIKDTIEDELADACIRLFDLAGLRKADLGETNEDELKCSEGFFDWTFTESIFSIVCDITDLDFFDKYPFDAYLRASIRLIMGFAVKRNIDIFGT